MRGSMADVGPPRTTSTPLTIGGETIRPGSKKSFELPVARLPTGTMLDLPVVVMVGRGAGPRLWLSAAIHGDELNGVEVIRQVLASLKVSQLSGAIIAVPVVNIFGFLEQSRYLPDRRDLNRCFPGSAKGSLASQLARLFMDEVVAHCDVGIDLHTGSGQRTNLPQVRGDLDDARTRELARAFAAPIAIHARLRDGSLREAAAQAGKPTLLFEAGEALRFEEGAIRAGVSGVRRVLQHLGMAPPPDEAAPPPPLEARSSRWVRASRSGILRLGVGLGDRVVAGQRLGFIGNLLTTSSRSVKAPVGGMIVGYTTSPLVNKGDAVVHIARLDEGEGGAVAPDMSS